MKIAVCLRQVPARDWQPRLDESRTWIEERDVPYELNEPDAYALEEALRLRERYGGEVVACSAGPVRVGQVLREALARGADRAVHVESEGLARGDASATAQALDAGLRSEPLDLILTGLQSDDQGFAQTGVILAERLGYAHATIVVEIHRMKDGRLRVRRELEGGWFQWVVLPLPAVLTIQSGINQLRYATLKGIMAAKRKDIRTVAAPAAAARQRIVEITLPEKSRKARLISGTPAEAARELVSRLRDEARALP